MLAPRSVRRNSTKTSSTCNTANGVSTRASASGAPRTSTRKTTRAVSASEHVVPAVASVVWDASAMGVRSDGLIAGQFGSRVSAVQQQPPPLIERADLHPGARRRRIGDPDEFVHG